MFNIQKKYLKSFNFALTFNVSERAAFIYSRMVAQEKSNANWKVTLDDVQKWIGRGYWTAQREVRELTKANLAKRAQVRRSSGKFRGVMYFTPVLEPTPEPESPPPAPLEPKRPQTSSNGQCSRLCLDLVRDRGWKDYYFQGRPVPETYIFNGKTEQEWRASLPQWQREWLRLEPFQDGERRQPMENEISKTVSLYRPSTLRENVKNHQQTSEARESAQTDPDPLAFLEWETVSRATVEQFLDEVPIPTREHLSIWIKRWLNCHYAIPDVELEGMLREFGREKLYAALVIAAEKTMASNTQGLFATVEPKFVAGILNRIGMPRPTFAADKPRKKFWDMDARERADEVERLIRFNRPQLGKLLKNPKVGSLYQATIGALRASRPHLFEESGTPFDNRASHIIQEAIQQEEQSKRESSAESRTSFQQAMGFSWSELSDVERGRMLREWATQ